MRLIATIGANRLDKEHKYSLKEKSFSAQISFLALAKAFGIKDIVLIGTEKSKESLSYILDEYDYIKMITIESEDVEDVFNKSLEYFTDETILDLTQGYRHYPMLTLLAALLLQNNKEKNIKEIYYAQAVDSDCHPAKNSCYFKFVSLLKYMDIGNITRVINTFTNTLMVVDYPIYDKDFKALKSSLEDISKEIFSNNYNATKGDAKKALDIIKNIEKLDKLDYVDANIQALKDEILKIIKLHQPKESKTLLSFSRYLLAKDIYLHSITILYESMVAFLDEKNIKKLCLEEKDRNGKLKKNDTYKKRNCLKKRLGNCKNSSHIYKCKEFSKALRNIDKLRNISAHAFTTDSHEKDLKEEIEKAILLSNQVFSQ